MNVNIQTVHFDADIKLVSYIEKKVEKLSRYYGKIISSEVSLRLDNSDTKENKLFEIRLAIPGNDLLASTQCQTFEEAVLNAVEIIKGQIKRKKTKIIGTRNYIVPQKL